MKTRKEALIIFSPAFSAGKTETAWLPWLQTFINTLNKNFSTLNVIVFAFQYPHTTKMYRWNNTLIIPFNGMHKKKAARLFMWLNIFMRVRKFKKQFHLIGILSLWCTECTFVAKQVSSFFGLKYFCWILGQDARKENTYVKRIRPAAASLVAISDFLVEEFYRSHHIQPQHVIPIGIDAGLFSSTTPVKDIDIIGVGSLSFIKQYDVFVQIIAALKRDLPNIKAVICGDGEAREQIEDLIEKLSLNENVTLTGFLQHLDALRLMQRAKILLHPSSYEGFGVACIEALYAGAHVFSFVQPMNHEIRNWHIVKTTEEMQMKALDLLKNANIEYNPVATYPIEGTARSILQLFESFDGN
jgi:glycosyltransferase involved in cell wall biosynthesis